MMKFDPRQRSASDSVRYADHIATYDPYGTSPRFLAEHLEKDSLVMVILDTQKKDVTMALLMLRAGPSAKSIETSVADPPPQPIDINTAITTTASTSANKDKKRKRAPILNTPNKRKRAEDHAPKEAKKKRAAEHIPMNKREAFGKLVNKFFISLHPEKKRHLVLVEEIMAESGVTPAYMTERLDAVKTWSEEEYKLMQAWFLIGVPLMKAYDNTMNIDTKKRNYKATMYQWLGQGKDANRVAMVGAEMTAQGFFDVNNHEHYHKDLFASEHISKLMRRIKDFEFEATKGNGFWQGALGLVVLGKY